MQFCMPKEINPDIIKSSAKKIADVFYNKHTSIQDRLKIIEHLRCESPTIENHYSINEFDAITLISCTYETSSICESVLHELNEAEALRQDNVSELMLRHHEFRKSKAESKRRLKECIKLWESGDPNALEQMPVIKPKQEENLVKKQPSILTQERTCTNNFRRKNVCLGYALLNLSAINSDNVWAILKNMMITLFENDLLQEEIEFVVYLFNHKQIPEDLLYLLFHNFSFLYEKPILRLCTCLLQSENAQEALENAKSDKTLTNIWNAACKNQSIANKIVNMLLHLHIVSDFNSSLLCVLNWFRNER